MSFKTHLVLVTILIIAILAGWKVMQTMPRPVAVQQQPAPPSEAEKLISIVRASWGLNCHPLGPDGQPVEIQENNVLSQVASLCNHKPSCSIPITPEALGGDAIAGCSDKLLEVEYRCFSYDRPWRAKGTQKMLTISCETEPHKS